MRLRILAVVEVERRNNLERWRTRSLRLGVFRRDHSYLHCNSETTQWYVEVGAEERCRG